MKLRQNWYIMAKIKHWATAPTHIHKMETPIISKELTNA